jgi:pimeloyl-ACP methyl ester carboxylesterase
MHAGRSNGTHQSGGSWKRTGVRLHYVDEGQGSPLVLLHEQASLLQDWTISVLPNLAARHRVIAFDRPGYGYSSRPQYRVWTARREAHLLKQALDRLGIERPVLVGHSWSAQIAMAFAIFFPEAVRSAVLISGFYYPSGRIGARLLGLAGQPVIGPLLSETLATPVSQMLRPAKMRSVFSPSEISPHFRLLPFALKERPVPLRTEMQEAGLVQPSAAELVPFYPEVRLPLAILAGGGDKIVRSREQSLRLHHEVPSSRLCLLENTGHMLHHIWPGEVMRAVDWAVEQGHP